MKLATPSPRALAATAVGAALALVLPAFFHVEHHQAWDRIPGFYAIFGAVGCGVLIVFSKWLGNAFLVKPEGWYGEERADGAAAGKADGAKRGEHA